jgi:hypothetical protein
MAELSPFVIALGDRNYPATHTAFLSYLEPYLDEIEGAREGEVSVLARIQKCMVMNVGFTQDLNANNFRITNLPAPLSASEPATKGYADAIKTYADGLSFAAALPAQTGNGGLSVVTDGTTARWSISNAEAMAILNFIGF